jgi:hypothetical protein
MPLQNPSLLVLYSSSLFGLSIRYEPSYTSSVQYLSSVSIMLYISAMYEYPAGAWCGRSHGETVVCFAALIEVSSSSLSTSKYLHILLIFPRYRALTSVSTVALSPQGLFFLFFFFFWNETIQSLTSIHYLLKEVCGSEILVF